MTYWQVKYADSRGGRVGTLRGEAISLQCLGFAVQC